MESPCSPARSMPVGGGLCWGQARLAVVQRPAALPQLPWAEGSTGAVTGMAPLGISRSEPAGHGGS